MSDIDDVKRLGTTNKRKILFSTPRLGSSIVLGIEGWALLTLYTSGYGLHPFWAGFSISMGYLTIAFSQFFLGWISDAKYTRWGRRKPYILVFAPLLGISIIFLLLPGMVIDLSDKVLLFRWMLIWEVIFRASYAVTTPYQAWMAEEFPAEERPKVSQFQNTFNYIGNGIMALFSLIILTSFIEALKIDINTPTPLNISIPIILFGVLTIVLFYIVAFTMPTEPHYNIKSNLFEALKAIIKNKNFMLIVLMVGISGLGWSMTTSAMLKYLEDVLNLGTIDYIISSVALLITIFIFLYIWRRLMQKQGKKKTLLKVFLLAVVFLPISLLGLIPMQSYLIIGIIFIVGIGAILGGWYLFPYVIYADVAEDDEKSTGELKAGIYTGFPSIILNIFQALGAFFVGSVLSLPTLVRHYVPEPYSFSIGLIIFGPVVSIILLISYFYTKKFITLDFDWEKMD
ncbi:MAG: MFS transporter [Promethearchaeota archaeon]|jgi:GPH family glycoside/pentoside/hexuronide:cation symporter